MTGADWLDRRIFPFQSRYFDVPGGKLHYVDEGAGQTILMVHGTPTWSFLFRHLISDLSRDYRVIAPDHLGFGLSDKPEGNSYTPGEHRRNLEALVHHLKLDDFTVTVHDFGGPIGLSYVLDHPERVRSVVLFNTWMWSLQGTPVEKVSRLMSGMLGKLLYTRLNFSPRVLLKAAFGDKSRLTPAIHRHYLKPFGTPADREAPWTLAKELIGSSDWYSELWRNVGRIQNIPALILWGMQDPTFGKEALAQWQRALPHATVKVYEESGHFIPEEEPRRAVADIRQFLSQ